MKKDSIGIKTIAQNNILSTEEACEVLGRTRQQLNNYVKNKDIETLKKMHNGNLFWKPDIYEFARILRREEIREQHEIIGYSTSSAIKAVEDMNFDKDEISEVYIFFHENDAIQRNFYNLCDVEIKDTLIRIEAPHFVIVMKNGREYWFEGLNCGYGGEGPHGAEKVLDMLGVLEKNDANFKKIIMASSILHFFRDENGGWECFCDESDYRDRGYSLNERYLDRISAKFFRFNHKLVLVQENKIFRWDTYDKNLFTEVLLKYINFILQPATVEFLTKEEAIRTGHFSGTSFRTVYYQIIIKDVMNRELWIEYPLEIDLKNNQATMSELLEMLGMNVNDGTFSDKVNQWLKRKPRLINKIHFSNAVK